MKYCPICKSKLIKNDNRSSYFYTLTCPNFIKKSNKNCYREFNESYEPIVEYLYLKYNKLYFYQIVFNDKILQFYAEKNATTIYFPSQNGQMVVDIEGQLDINEDNYFYWENKIEKFKVFI